MKHFYQNGKVKLRVDAEPLVREAGTRIGWLQIPAALMRHKAMAGVGTRLGFQPKGVGVSLKSTLDPDFMEGKVKIEEDELYVGRGFSRLAWPGSKWQFCIPDTYDDAELEVLKFAQRAESEEVDKEIKDALKGKKVVIVDTRYGFPTQGEVFLQKAVEMHEAP